LDAFLPNTVVQLYQDAAEQAIVAGPKLRNQCNLHPFNKLRSDDLSGRLGKASICFPSDKLLDTYKELFFDLAPTELSN
jgi:hypothetical protein